MNRDFEVCLVLCSVVYVGFGSLIVAGNVDESSQVFLWNLDT